MEMIGENTARRVIVTLFYENFLDWNEEVTTRILVSAAIMRDMPRARTPQTF